MTDDKCIDTLRKGLNNAKAVIIHYQDFINKTNLMRMDESWHNTKCSNARFFAHEYFQNESRMIWIDADSLMLGRISESGIYNVIGEIQARRALIAATVESLEGGWYSNVNDSRKVGKTGLNSGVLVLNLDEMRKLNFTELWLEKYTECKHMGGGCLKIPDQDVMNLLLSDNLSYYQELGSQWNFRTDFGNALCNDTYPMKFLLLHGNRQVLRNKWSFAHNYKKSNLDDLVRKLTC